MEKMGVHGGILLWGRPEKKEKSSPSAAKMIEIIPAIDPFVLIIQKMAPTMIVIGTIKWIHQRTQRGKLSMRNFSTFSLSPQVMVV